VDGKEAGAGGGGVLGAAAAIRRATPGAATGVADGAAATGVGVGDTEFDLSVVLAGVGLFGDAGITIAGSGKAAGAAGTTGAAGTVEDEGLD